MLLHEIFDPQQVMSKQSFPGQSAQQFPGLTTQMPYQQWETPQVQQQFLKLIKTPAPQNPQDIKVLYGQISVFHQELGRRGVKLNPLPRQLPAAGQTMLALMQGNGAPQQQAPAQQPAQRPQQVQPQQRPVQQQPVQQAPVQR